MSKYEFKYRLTQKSSLATIAKAVRALGYSMCIEKRGAFTFSWLQENLDTGREMYEYRTVLDENIADFLNIRLEENGLLAPIEKI